MFLVGGLVTVEVRVVMPIQILLLVSGNNYKQIPVSC